MNKTTRTLASLAAAGSLIAAPAVAQGAPKDSHGKGHAKAHGKANRCGKVHTVGFSVGGTLVSYTADDPATTGVNEASVTLKVTSANRAARQSGELADQDAMKDGVQVDGATYTVAGAPVKRDDFEGTDTASPGDKVKVKAKVAVTKTRCAPAGTSTADRYGKVDVRRVTISDRDEDAPVAPEQPAPIQS